MNSKLMQLAVEIAKATTPEKYAELLRFAKEHENDPELPEQVAAFVADHLQQVRFSLGLMLMELDPRAPDFQTKASTLLPLIVGCLIVQSKKNAHLNAAYDQVAGREPATDVEKLLREIMKFSNGAAHVVLKGTKS